MAPNESDAVLGYLPARLREKLMIFQKDGIKYGIKKRGRCLVADEMGLGKTLQALAIAYYYKAKWPLLIVVPSSLRYPWIEEVEKWFPDIHPHEINLIQSGSDVGGISSAQITVVTYGLLRHPASKVVREALGNQKFHVAIVDESHYIKNRKSASTRFLVPLLQPIEHTLLLTGTPALARPAELFPQLDALCPGVFGTWSNYSKKFCDAQMRFFGKRRQWDTDGASNLDELQHMLTTHVMIRRLKKDVLKQLPPKCRQKISFPLKDSDVKKELDTTWTELKNALGHKHLGRVLNQTEGSIEDDNSSSFEVYGLMSQLFRDTCNAKVGPVKDYLKMLCDNVGLKLIVFAHHHVMMDSLTEQLMDDHVKFIRIDGRVPHQDRPRLVHQYQSDPLTRVALLSIKAAGVGLTLTAAKLVVFAELDWTPGVLQQCEDRAHRIGQTDTVHVHYLVAKETLDEWVWSALEQKTTVVTATLNGQTQVLKADEGNAGQVECLSNADAYVPTKTSLENVSGLFEEQKDTRQKTMKAFFSPSQNKDFVCEPIRNTLNDSSSDFTSKKKKKKPKALKRAKTTVKSVDNECGVQDAITVVDDSDLEDFDSVGSQRNTVELKETESKRSECVEHLVNDNEGIPAFPPRRKKRRLLLTADDENIVAVPDSDSQGYEEEMETKDTQNETTNTVESDIVTTPVDMCKSLQWSCDICTFLNHEELSFCEMCSSVKSSPTKRKKTEYGGKCLSSASGEGTRQKGFRFGASSNSSPTPGSSRCDGINNDTVPIMESHHLSADKKDKHLNCSLSDHNKSGETSFYGKHNVSDSEEEFCATEELAIVEDYESDECMTPVINHDETDDETDIVEYGSEDAGDVNRDDGVEEFQSQDLFSDNSQGSGTSHATINETEKFKCDNTEMGFESPIRQTGIDAMIAEEEAAAKMLFSPGTSRAATPWMCEECGIDNDSRAEDCDGCLASRPEADKHTNDQQPAERHVDLDTITVHEQFLYCCSKNSSRIYLYDTNGEPLNVNFLPLDVELGNYSELPDLLLHPDNLKLVRRFVTAWGSLSVTKQRVVLRTGQVFLNPVVVYNELKIGKKSTTQRYRSKADVAASALSRAEEIGGSVRVINRQMQPPDKKKPNISEGVGMSSTAEEVSEIENIESVKGIVQAMDSEGQPLCVHCHAVYDQSLVSGGTVDKLPWQTRFCTRECMQEYFMVSHRGYSVQQVYEAEHGICQLCNFDADHFFIRIKKTNDIKHRAQLIKDSKYNVLKPETKQRMVQHPSKGLFWHVDHITPVAEGGGQCDLDNLRTLCVLCHHDVTRQQSQQRAKVRRQQKAAECGDITAFFKPA